MFVQERVLFPPVVYKEVVSKDRGMQVTVAELSAMTRKRFAPLYYAQGFSADDLEQLEVKLAAAPEPERTEQLFLKHLIQIARRRPDLNFMGLNPFVREFQAFSNHVVFRSRGMFPTRFLETIVISRDEQGRRTPDNIETFMELALAAHQEIDAYFAGRQKGIDETRTSMRHILAQMGHEVSAEEEAHLRLLSSDIAAAASVSHYALDWHLTSSPHLANQKAPQRLAGLTMYAVRMMNLYAGGCDIVGTTGQIAEFAGYGRASSIPSTGQTIFYDVIYAMSDPTLLFIRPTDLPSDWEKRLLALAPGLAEVRYVAGDDLSAHSKPIEE